MRYSQAPLRFLLAFTVSAACAISVSAQAQQPTSDPCAAPAGATFEVASVHEMKEISGGTSMSVHPDQLTAKGVSVFRLLLSAFNLHEFQIFPNLPDWARSTRYEVTAKIDPAEPQPASMSEAERDAYQQRVQQRLRSLLVDRFALKCHMETKEQPVYELVVAKGGPKMTPTNAEVNRRGSFSSNGDGLKMHARGTGLTTARIAFLASNEVNRIVIDKTGLTGMYDFQVDWVHESTAASAENVPDGPSIFTAIEEQLGLKLLPAKAPVPVLVVDHIERPTDN